MIEKWRNFSLPSLFSLSSFIGEKGRGLHQVDYSVKFVLFTLMGFKVKVGAFRVKFVKVYE